VAVIRDGTRVNKTSKDLVPGDVIILPTHSDSFTMECDAVLMSGSLTMDESMLTGESVPISKVPLTEDSNSLFSPIHNKNNTLFCGTQVLHVQSTNSTYVKAIVIRTGNYQII
jgi:cation-transporting ATPase 13A3/4/5